MKYLKRRKLESEKERKYYYPEAKQSNEPDEHQGGYGTFGMTGFNNIRSTPGNFSGNVPYSGFGNSSQNKLSSDMWGNSQTKNNQTKLTTEDFERLQKKALPQDYMGERESNYQFY